jgi:hypothetical protein
MNKNEEIFRKEKANRDQETLDEKVSRWKQIEPSTYAQLPKLMWEYLVVADEMFVDGYFLGVVLLCAAITETVLSNQLVSNNILTSVEIERFTLEQMSIITNRLGTITDTEKKMIDDLRCLRNNLIHVNVGKLSKRIKLNSSHPFKGMEPELYLSSIDDGNTISSDALKYLGFTRGFTMRFYGAKK